MTAYPANTLTATGSSTAPGAGAAVASITAPPDGLYTVILTIILTGTAETLLRNLRLRENANTVADTLPSLSASAGPVQLIFDQVEVNPGGGNLDVIAIAAATAGAIYNIVLQATRVA
jgi:hypothetical protein